MGKQYYHIQLLLLRLGLMELILLLAKGLFTILNFQSFPGLEIAELPKIFFSGMRFDVITLVYLNSIFILMHILPFPFRDRKGYQKALKIIFLVINIPIIAIELTDIAYFPFNNKRMTSDIAGVATAGLHRAFFFFIDFWYLFLAFGILIYILVRFYKKHHAEFRPIKYRIGIQILFFLLMGGLAFLGARGGTQNIPATPAMANDFTDVKYAPLVLNSTYTVLYSSQRKSVSPPEYLPVQQVAAFLQKGKTFNGGSNHPNIMLVLLESFASEYIGFFNNGKGFTPFMDSLLQQSYVFTNAYANAERSNKSMCVILGGLPSLTDDAFMNTIYSANCFEGIGSLLKENGYYTSFLHGGLNGEFKFDSFSHAAGFDHYYGKDEFNDNRYFDGNWGIYDHYFFEYAADVINKQPQPFCSAIFSLSSHHPFNVPADLKAKFPDGDQQIHESIGYTDYAVRLFFEKSKNKPWFKNTIFIFTADHTFPYGEHPPMYNNGAGKYRVPIAIYKADGSLAPAIDSTLVQHLDILPTAIDLAGYNGSTKCYGSSVFAKNRLPYAIQYLNNVFQVEDRQYILFFDGKKTIGLYNYIEDVACNSNLMDQLPEKRKELEQYVMSVIQDYFTSLNRNNMCN